MKKAIIAKKIGMTQIFGEKGTVIPVTVLQAEPMSVVQLKTIENDGYSAVQVGFGPVKLKRVTKPVKGHYDKAGVAPKKLLREFKYDDAAKYSVGDEITVELFAAGDRVDISGTSKGKGFQGSIKRHNQQRGRMTHGSKYHRGVGSMSSGTTPGRVKKNKNMPGHMGAEKVTVQNLTVVRVDAERKLMLVKGAVPGVRGAVVIVKETTKSK